MTYTYAELVISQAAYEEIADKLMAAGYHHAFCEDGAIDMHGIALTREEPGDHEARHLRDRGAGPGD